MHAREPTIIALGGGGYFMEPENPLLDRYVLEATGADAPRVCLLSTAGGDRPEHIEGFTAAYTALGARVSHLTLPWIPSEGGAPEAGSACGTPNHADIAGHLAAHDVVYVGGGNTRRMLAIWKHYGVADVLRALWSTGQVVMAGVSAGALCWHAEGVTDSVPGVLTTMQGLGWLPGSFCPHYDGEPGRRPAYEGYVARGALAPGIAADDSCALHYTGTRLGRIVASTPTASAWRVEIQDGTAHSERLDTQYLGAS